MKFSEKWLREWVNPSLSAHELSEQLSMAGLEVDGVEPVAGDFKGVLVGEVVECGQHPNADKLRVTKIACYWLNAVYFQASHAQLFRQLMCRQRRVNPLS